uniref:Uncharacterized protein n=1 Tax=Arundo donax TaxID=35708 RepID=A0A0A8XUV1_ARUDO
MQAKIQKINWREWRSYFPMTRPYEITFDLSPKRQI